MSKGLKQVIDGNSECLREDPVRSSAPGGVGLDALSLADSEQQFRRLFDSARDGILFVDRGSGEIVDVNPFLLGLLGYETSSELVGRHLWDIGMPGDEVASRDSFRELREGCSVRYDDLPLATRDGRRVEVEFVGNVYRTGDHPIIQCNVRDISARRRAEASNARLAAIVGGSDDAIIGKDLSGVITSWNGSAALLFGYSAGETLGGPISIIIPDDRLAEEEAILSRIRLGEKIHHFETVRRRKDGILVEISLTISPIRDAAGRVVGASKIARDVTARRRADLDLEQALKAAEEAGRVKDLFLSALSHELRTPLTPILAAATSLEAAHDMPESLRADVETIRRNVDLEARLIDDLLEMTRIGRGKLDLHYEVLDAHVVIRAALDLCQADVDSKSLEVAVAMRAESHLVWGDSARLQQVFWNLIKNAAKFTPAGGSIRICTADSHGRLLIEVSDTGEGIEASFLPRLFDAFEQGNLAASRRHGGLGLGLTVARMVVDLHGGTLTAESEGVGQGSTFRVQLEQVSGVPIPTTPSLPSDPPAAVVVKAPLKLLLVEDNLDTLRTIGQLLRTMGFMVRPASCVSEALESMASERPDLLISDIGLPDGSGLEIMQQARDVYGVKGIAFSGYSSREDVAESLAAGFSHHLAKPSSLNDLVRLIRETAV